MYSLNRIVFFLKRSSTRSWLGRAAILCVLLSLTMFVSGCSSDDEDEPKAERSEVSKASGTSSLRKSEAITQYSIDEVNGAAVPKLGWVVINAANTPAISIGGWAVDAPAKAPAGGVFFNVDGKSDLPATYGVSRPDVADVLKEPNYKTSGFGISIPTASLEKGHHILSLRVLTSDKTAYYEPKQKIEIEIQ